MQTPGKQAFASPGFKIAFLVTPTLAIALDFSLKNALFDRFLFTQS